jgi:N-acetylmuramic acid 6-phosphate etherase
MQLEDFVKNQSYFSLGHLPTEQPHPASKNLSELSTSDPAEAIRILQKIDLHALKVVEKNLPNIRSLGEAILATWAEGHRVFLSGCGATGRLALTLESLYRKMHRGSAREDQVHALMAGGDFALVKSVENFEDYPEYGTRHLLDLGFKDGDLLIAITEGGETPYVIGTVLGALAHSSADPWFVYCNPRELLVATLPRSREVIENPRVKSLDLSTGPMALSGSTRLQAASVQMFAVGLALFQNYEWLKKFLAEYEKLDLVSFLKPLIEWEAQQYQDGKFVLYETSDYAIAVLTDTTERSPTFSLAPFEKSLAEVKAPSLSYLSIPDANDSASAWLAILNRKPIGLAWPELMGRFDRPSILEFDFSKNTKRLRAKKLAPKIQSSLRVSREKSGIIFSTDSFASRLETSLLEDPLCEQILIKLVLNTLSLLVMGRLGRYEGNIMTWVRASNGKLVDRTLRYLELLIEKRKLPPFPRTLLVEKLFQTLDHTGPDEAIVLKILESLQTDLLRAKTKV